MIPVTWYAIAALVVTNLITGTLWRFAAGDVEKMQIMGKVAEQEAKRVIAEQERITDVSRDSDSGLCSRTFFPHSAPAPASSRRNK